ncbi:MAG: tetratricopeptide repeat protein, partial [Terracidiphilus sp.]
MNSTPNVPERNRNRLSSYLRRRGFLALTALLVAITVLSGCHRDPEVAKQKYMESGKRYSAQGKWREATIQFSNALKIDRNFPEAHFELAQTLMHMGQIKQSYVEYQKTVDLDPTNFPARIALANILLRAN